MSHSKKMLGLLFSVSYLALMAAISDGHAQTANANAGAASNAGAQSGSNSGAAAIINQTTNVPANTTSTNTNNINDRVSGGTNNTLTTSDRSTSDVTLRTTPTVYAPPVSGGNPCTLAVSGGVSVIGWGAAAGGTFVDQDCANRQKIAMIHNAGYQGVAFELMCNDKDTYNAVKSSGSQRQCAFRQAFEPQGAQPRPTPVVLTPVVTPPPMVQAAPPKQYPKCSRTIVDNCHS